MPKFRIVASVIAVLLTVSSGGLTAASAAEPQPAATTVSNATRLVRDIGPGWSIPWYQLRERAVRVGKQVYFVVSDDTNGEELWKSDGTRSGTNRVKAPPSNGGGGIISVSPSNLAALGKYVLYAGNTRSHGRALVRSDGTSAGTKLVKDITPMWMGPVLGKYLYFMGKDQAHGTELWRTDGTTAGTTLVSDTNPGEASGGGSHMIAWKNAVYFSGDDGVNGRELWKTAGTPESSQMVEDARPGPEGSSPYLFEALGDLLYFFAFDPAEGVELRVSDGESVRLVAEVAEGAAGSYGREPTARGGYVYFATDTGLWRSNGTAEGTRSIAEFPVDTGGPSALTTFRGELYFTLGVGGGDLYRTNGPSAVTRIDLGIAGASVGNETPFGCGTTLYFAATDPKEGSELWSTKGLSSNVRRLIVRPGKGDAYPDPVACLNNKLFFAATTSDVGREPRMTK